MGKNTHSKQHIKGEFTLINSLLVSGKIPRMTDSLADRIQNRMAELGLNPSSAGARVGKSRELIRNVLRGQSNTPSATNLKLIAEALETSSEWLLEGKGEPGATDRLPKQTGNVSPSTQRLGRIPIRGEVAAGMWREHDDLAQDLDEPPQYAPTVSNDRYPARSSVCTRCSRREPEQDRALMVRHYIASS